MLTAVRVKSLVSCSTLSKGKCICVLVVYELTGGYKGTSITLGVPEDLPRIMSTL